jgi:hypothetical protein
MADTIEELFNTNRKACKRLIPRMLRQLNLYAQEGEVAHTVRTALLRIKAIQALIWQELGSRKHGQIALGYAQELKNEGLLEKAIWIVWRSHTFDTCEIKKESIGAWIQWILQSCPYTKKKEYSRVVNLLAFVFYHRTFQLEKSIRCLLRSIGSIHPAYASKRLSYLIDAFGSVNQANDEDASVLIGQTLLDSTEHMFEEDRLHVFLQQYLMLRSDHVNTEHNVEVVRRIGAVAEDRGYATLRAHTLLDEVSFYNAKNGMDALAELMDKALSYGGPRCGIVMKSFYLGMAMIPKNSFQWPGVRDVVKKHYTRLKRTSRGLFDVELQLLAAGIGLYPERTTSIVRDVLTLYPKEDLAKVGEVVVHLAMVVARNNVSVTIDGCLEWCLHSSLLYARRNYQGTENKQLELGFALSTMLQERRHQKADYDSSRSIRNLTVAKVKHDIKYHLQYLEECLRRYHMDGGSSLADILASIRAIQGVFSKADERRSIRDVVADVHHIVETVERMSTSKRCHISIGAIGDRDIVLGHYENVHSGLFNILLNAFQHSAPGTPVGIDIHEHDSVLSISISNEVEGELDIPQRSVQLVESHRIGYSSRGSGLAITRQLLQSSGITVDIRKEQRLFHVVMEVPLWS